MQWTSNLCRICGEINQTCYLIYNNNLPNDLGEKVKKCLHLNLFKDDFKPKQICKCCALKLNEFSDFIDMCYITNQKLESIYYSTQNWQDKSDCMFFAQKQSVIVVNNKQPTMTYTKNTVNTTASCSSTLTEHDILSIVENQAVYNNYTQQLNPYNDALRQNFAMKQQFRPECLSSKPVVTVDEVRNKVKPTETAAKAPRVKKHHACPQCSKKFLRRSSLNAHMAVHTNIRPYACSECTKSFAIKSELSTHKKIHTDNFKCQFCSKKFTVPSKLKRHLRIHTNIRPFVCDVSACGRAFTDKRNLQGHSIVHYDDRQYVCDVCKVAFKSKSRLNQHFKLHNTNEMFACNLCPKEYRYKSNLVAHLKNKKHSS